MEFQGNLPKGNTRIQLNSQPVIGVTISDPVTEVPRARPINSALENLESIPEDYMKEHFPGQSGETPAEALSFSNVQPKPELKQHEVVDLIEAGTKQANEATNSASSSGVSVIPAHYFKEIVDRTIQQSHCKDQLIDNLQHTIENQRSQIYKFLGKVKEFRDVFAAESAEPMDPSHDIYVDNQGDARTLNLASSRKLIIRTQDFARRCMLLKEQIKDDPPKLNELSEETFRQFVIYQLGFIPHSEAKFGSEDYIPQLQYHLSCLFPGMEYTPHPNYKIVLHPKIHVDAREEYAIVNDKLRLRYYSLMTRLTQIHAESCGVEVPQGAYQVNPQNEFPPANKKPHGL